MRKYLEEKPEYLTLPNILSLSRLLFTPFFVYFIIKENLSYAFVFFLLVVAADAADGYLARKFGQETKFGAVIDPIGDKVFVLSALIVFVEVFSLPFWKAVTIFSRDIAMAIIGLMIILKYSHMQKKELKAKFFGKITTVLQFVMIFVIMFNMQLQEIIFYLIIVFSILAVVQYCYVLRDRLV